MQHTSAAAAMTEDKFWDWVAGKVQEAHTWQCGFYQDQDQKTVSWTGLARQGRYADISQCGCCQDKNKRLIDVGLPKAVGSQHVAVLRLLPEP